MNRLRCGYRYGRCLSRREGFVWPLNRKDLRCYPDDGPLWVRLSRVSNRQRWRAAGYPRSGSRRKKLVSPRRPSAAADRVSGYVEDEQGSNLQPPGSNPGALPIELSV